jgi:maltose O-acetyltransferase
MIRRWIVPIRIKFFKKINDYLIESQREDLIQRMKSCGSGCHLYLPFHICAPGQLEVGNNVSIGTYVHMWCHGGIKIGDRVLIASHTAITSVTHDHTQSDMRKDTIRRSVIIEDDVWIGAHSIILPGVTIDKGAVVGANSVVTKDVEPYAIIMGSPARHYKYREVTDVAIVQ